MKTIGDVHREVQKIKSGLEKKVEDTIVANSSLLVGLVREQLYAGTDGSGRYLTPSYSADPWFRTPEAGRWKNNPKGYAKYKPRGKPNINPVLGLPPKPLDAPSLFIRGDFYDSITAVPVSGGIEITTKGVSFGSDIIKKYGLRIFQLSPTAKEYFIRNILSKEIANYLSKG